MPMQKTEQHMKVGAAFKGSPRMKSIAPAPSLTITQGFDEKAGQKLHAGYPKKGPVEDPWGKRR